jgi:hypothetical protein
MPSQLIEIDVGPGHLGQQHLQRKPCWRSICNGRESHHHHDILSVIMEMPLAHNVGYISSSTLTAIRSATVVTVVNQSDSICGVRVEWFVSPNPATPLCTRNIRVDPGEAVQFCSRRLPDSITARCNACEGAPGQTELTSQNEGKAIVSSSSAGFECSLLGVEARVYYTTGETPPDMAISAISNSKIVFIGEGNLGD